MESRPYTGRLGPNQTFNYIEMDDGRPETSASSARQDARDMRRLGNEQVLQRNFHSLSILGLTCILISTWQSVLSLSSLSLTNGGRAGTVWVYLVGWGLNIPVVASLAEMVSMAPTASGQYHWVSEFAPPNFQKPLSYLSGWLAALGWQTVVAALSFQCAFTLLILISVAHPTYQPQAWHETLLMILIAVIAILFNIFAAKKLPHFEGAIFCCYILGFFAAAIPLWTLTPKVTVGEVFTKFENNGGWPNIGIACMVGQITGSASLIGVDSAAHMSEEVRSASTTIPRMMMLTILLNGALGFIMIVSFAFVVQDIPSQILQSNSAYPFIGVFLTATESKRITIGMTIPMIIINFGTCINGVMSASRQSWAFARDRGLPFWPQLTKITPIYSTPLPVNSMAASLIITVVIALLNLGGSEVVSSFVGLGGAAFGATYSLSIACVLWRRLFGEPLPYATWSLGKYGPAINIVALIYQMLSMILSFFPVYAQVTLRNMNWSCAVFGGVVLLSVGYYQLAGKKTYRSPVERVLAEGIRNRDRQNVDLPVIDSDA